MGGEFRIVVPAAGPFFLSCRDAAAALALPGDEPHVTAWRWLNALCEKGVLVKGKVGTLAGRRATEFRYVVG